MPKLLTSLRMTQKRCFQITTKRAYFKLIKLIVLCHDNFIISNKIASKVHVHETELLNIYIKSYDTKIPLRRVFQVGTSVQRPWCLQTYLSILSTFQLWSSCRPINYVEISTLSTMSTSVDLSNPST